MLGFSLIWLPWLPRPGHDVETTVVKALNAICVYSFHLHFPFSALTLLVGRQKGHRARKKLGVGLLVVMI